MNGISEPKEVSNIFTYTPSRLLKKNEWEFQLFNNLYTQTAYRDENRDKIYLNERSTYYTGLIYLLFGISQSGRFNVGLDVNIRSVLNDTAKGTPFKVFQFQNAPNSRTALTILGPKIKFQPIRDLPNFSVQSAFWIPIAYDLEGIEAGNGHPWLDYNMYTWWNQFFYDKTFGSNWQIFSEADLLFRFKKKTSNTPSHLETPVSFFLSWFPLSRATVYYQIQYSPRFQLEKMQTENNSVEPFTYTSDYAHTGLGAKYQASENLNFEISSTYFFSSKNGGAGMTFNIGIRIIL